jgi:hypothetical protein
VRECRDAGLEAVPGFGWVTVAARPGEAWTYADAVLQTARQGDETEAMARCVEVLDELLAPTEDGDSEQVGVVA